MKKTKLILLMAFLALVFCAGVLTAYRCVRGGENWSSAENRWLASFPEISAQGLLSGKSFDDLEGYLKDHFAGRTQLLKLGTGYEMKLRRKPIVSDVVIAEKALLPEAPIPDYRTDWLAGKAERMAARLEEIQRVTQENGGVFLYVSVPEQRTALRDFYPDWMENGMAYYEAVAEAFSAAMQAHGVEALDLTADMTAAGVENCYSLVDHHYNLYGAKISTEAVCARLSEMGVAIDVSGAEIADSGIAFVGTYDRKLYGFSPLQQTLQTDIGEPIAYQRWDNGERTDAPLIDAREGSDAYYTAYMGGDKAETVLKMDAQQTLPRVLLVGDSFTNAMECLLYRGCRELRSLDFRHYTEKTLTDYIAEYQPDAVIILRDDISSLEETGNGNLE